VQSTIREGVAAQRANPETMSDVKASRTLVKSAPELWAECSDGASLARHLGAFGEIRITKLEPETAVAWEGEAARGTVRLEPSGWGTRVVLTAAGEQLAPQSPGAAQAAAEPEAEPEPPAPAASAGTRRTLLRRVFRRWPRRTRPAPAAAEPEPEAEPKLEPEPPAVTAAGRATLDALDAALDSLGSAHHRPYSRA
jgi:hypothetical protein